MQCQSCTGSTIIIIITNIFSTTFTITTKTFAMTMTMTMSISIHTSISVSTSTTRDGLGASSRRRVFKRRDAVPSFINLDMDIDVYIYIHICICILMHVCHVCLYSSICSCI